MRLLDVEIGTHKDKSEANFRQYTVTIYVYYIINLGNKR
jgi:hypothetical protein